MAKGRGFGESFALQLSIFPNNDIQANQQKTYTGGQVAAS